MNTRRRLIGCGMALTAWMLPMAFAGTLDVIAEAAFAGDRGLRVVVDDRRATYVEDTVALLSQYRARFYVNLDGLTFVGDGAFDLIAGFNNGGDLIFRVFIERGGGETRLRYAALPNAGPPETLSPEMIDLASGWRRVEISWLASNGSGHLRIWIDGVAQSGLNGLTNSSYTLRTVRLGAASDLEPTGPVADWVSGSFDLDEFISRATGLIGAAPTTSGIGDVRVNVNAPAALVSLFDAFEDEEDDDNELTFDVPANSNEALFSSIAVDETNGNLVLVFAADVTGTADVTVRATDTSDLQTETTFAVVVSGPPTTGGIADVSVNANSEDTVIDLFAAFDDPEDADDALEYSITGNSNPSLFSGVAIDGAAGTLTLDYAPNAGGVAELTVRATDPGGLLVDTTFTVTVNAAPTTTGIDDVSVPVGTAQTVVDLAAAFADAEDAAADLTYSLLANTNEALFDAAAVDNTTDRIVLAYAADVTGSAELTIRATDSGGLFVEDSFTVTVTPAGGGFSCHRGGVSSSGRGDILAIGAALFLLLVLARPHAPESLIYTPTNAVAINE